MLSVLSLFPVPQQMQGFSADDVFDAEPVDTAELHMSVDGKLSAGKIFVPFPWSITLQANSDSNAFFDAWNAAERAQQEKLPCQGVVLLTSIGTTWAMVNGFLTTFPTMPNAKKTLQPRKYGITWEDISPAISV